jgi:hypothetical protein
VKRDEAAGHEVKLRFVEAVQQRAHVVRGEHLKVRRVVVRRTSE